MSRKNQIKRLDALWSRLVVERDKSICQKCGEFGDNPHHVVLKRYLAVKHLLDNGLTLCSKHHVPYAHARPALFEKWFKREFPDRWERIQELKQNIKPDLDEAEKRLKEGIK